MKFAVRKEEGQIPGAGFHYMLHPIAMRNDIEAAIFSRTGHLIIEVDTATGNRLINEACAALNHQCEVALITEKQNQEQKA